MSRYSIEHPHTISIDDAVKTTAGSLTDGITDAEASSRLEEFGRNELEGGKGISPLKILLRNVNNIIVYLLAAAGIAAFVMGDTVEGVAVIIAIIIAVVSGFVTEYNAQRSVESLQKMITTTAKVKRGGRIREIDSSELVVGDLIYLEEGDSITADARLVESTNFAVMEAALTGESEAVDKDAEGMCELDAPLGDRINMVFTGTAVTRGNAFALIIATANRTEMGKISALMEDQEQEKTPLEKQLNRLGTSLIVFAAAVAVLVTLFGIISGEDIYEMITIGIILAIAAIPEALPAVSTITLAIGMRVMARKDALVKSLPAVETLGSTTVICTDKTGTLTENQMTVRKIILPDGAEIDVDGAGYEPQGNFQIDGNAVDPAGNRALTTLLEAGMLASNATLSQEDDFWQVIGDPTEGGLIAAARKADISRQKIEDSGAVRVGEIPFNSSDKFMAVSWKRLAANKAELFVKGAPDVLIGMAGLDDDDIAIWSKRNRLMAVGGMRVLAVGRVESYNGQSDEESMRSALTAGIEILGLCGIVDPPREDVKQAVSVAKEAGIRVIMITGDHPETARSIARQIGITDNDEVLTGREMDKLGEKELAQRIKTTSVFARVSPENKLQIVSVLNIAKEVTAMTGDGVNDAPALQGADIGVAMGIRGTEVAKEAADMILTRDRFSTIVEAVREGRAIFDNIEKFVFYLFSCNVVEIVMIFLAIAFKLPLPVLALQILWLNLVVDVLPAMSLAWEPGEKGIMTRPPRDPRKGIMNRRFLGDILITGALIGIGSLAVFWIGLELGYSESLARTISFTTLAVGQLVHILNVRKKNGFGLDKTFLKNRVLLIALASSLLLQAAVIYVPFLQHAMDTRPLNLMHWGLVMLGSIVPTVLIQLIRLIRKK